MLTYGDYLGGLLGKVVHGSGEFSKPLFWEKREKLGRDLAINFRPEFITIVVQI